MAPKQAAVHYCSMCTDSFTSRGAYERHILNHPESSPTTVNCPACNWSFPDSLALEKHQIVNGCSSQRYSCNNCGIELVTPRGLKDHMKPPGCSKAAASSSSFGALHPHPPAHQQSLPARPDPPIPCDRCAKTFSTREELKHHRSFAANTPCSDHNYKTPPKNRAGYVDPDKPNNDQNGLQTFLGYESSSEGDSDAPTNMTDGTAWCGACKTKFKSLAQYNVHFLRCTTQNPAENTAPVPPSAASVQSSVTTKSNKAIQTPLPSVTQHLPGGKTRKPRSPKKAAPAPANPSPIPRKAQPPPVQAPPTTKKAQPPTSAPSNPPIVPATGDFPCNFKGCQKVCRSEAGLKVHKQDSHGIGGRPVDLTGKDSWMLNQTTRNDLRQEGLLRAPPTGPYRGRGGGRPSPCPARPPPPPPPPIHAPPVPQLIPAFRPLPQVAPRQIPVQAPQAIPTSHNLGGVYDMDQAKQIQGKIMRLLIQTDIFIHHDGKMSVCGIDWTRIGVQKQADVPGLFQGMTHIPKKLYDEYLPPPKGIANEYTAEYPASEFSTSPEHDRFKPGLAVVAIACSKVLLSDGCQEVVKIAAIDLITGRILMDHLVCTSGTLPVANWRSNETGLFSWEDMEQARKMGYKVFKGWSAVRSALYKVIDKETIIVGHNLRSDFDSLRMIHGRAVDIAKVAEKRANGPLSKAQLSLDSLCRDYPLVSLKSDPEYGRDVLMNAFAIREMALWVMKNEDKFDKSIKQKSREYEMIKPKTAPA